MKDFSQKLALVTGGSSGIGLAVARQLAKMGANVWILARRESLIASALKDIEANRVRSDQRFGSLCTDVSDEAKLNLSLEKFLKEIGTPDLLINAAGISRPGLFLEQDTAVFHELVSTNYFGTVNTIKRIAPEMVKRGSGHIVNISSLAGFVGIYGYAAYGATKYAVAGLTDVLRVELKPHNIKLSIVYPADTQTPGFDDDQPHLPPLTRQLSADNAAVQSADYVAAAILKGVQKNQYVIVPGSDAVLLYQINNIFGNFRYQVMDFLLASAQKKLDRGVPGKKP